MGYICLSHVYNGPRKEIFDQAKQLSFWNWKREPFFKAKPRQSGELKEHELYSFDVEVYSFIFEAKYFVEQIKDGSLIIFSQKQGLFKNWNHSIHFESMDDGRTLVTNTLAYKLPLGLFGTLLSDLLIREKLTESIDAKWNKIIQG